MKKIKIVSYILTVVLLTVCSAFSAFALDGSFYLTNEEARENRLFEVRLKADCEDVSAFVAEIEFDSQALAYRSVKNLVDGSEYSVNTAEDGRIIVAWVCANGVYCNDKALLSFEFKALKAGKADFSLDVSQAISSACADISAEAEADFSVEILPKSSGDTKEKPDKSEVTTQSETETSTKGEPLNKNIKGTPSGFPLAVLSAAAVAVLVPCAVIIVLKIPKKKNKNKE